MELAGFKKVKITDIITAVQFDYFVTSSVNDNSFFLVCRDPEANIIEDSLYPQKTARCACRQKDMNDNRVFRKIKMGPGMSGEPGRFIESIFTDCKKDHVDLLIDYSCMPVSWYANIMDAIYRISSGIKVINAYMVYLPKRCAPGDDDRSPVTSVIKSRKQNRKPLSVIVGLDQVPLRASELEEIYKPREIAVFIPETVTDPGYVENIKKSNRSFLDKVSNFNLINYPVDDPDEINSKLASLCLKMRLKSEVAIVPGGPKIFSVMALLISMQYPDIKIIEVKSKNTGFSFLKGFLRPVNNSLPVAIRATFCEEIDDLEYVYR